MLVGLVLDVGVSGALFELADIGFIVGLFGLRGVLAILYELDLSDIGVDVELLLN